ncbi:HAD-IIIC family phosphatase [Alphaproteobacteria bacterium]|jgi:FkbH-like protein|nr:HAD-IIIC family phosphatase [Alphaproteobacteria bacterium]
MKEHRRKTLESALRDPFLVSQDTHSLQKLAKIFSKSKLSPEMRSTDTRVALCGGFMTKFLVEILPLFFLQRGITPTFYESEYGSFQQDIINNESELSRFDPELVIFFPTHRDLRFPPPTDASNSMVENCLGREVDFWINLLKNLDAPTVLFTFDPPPTRRLGEADGLKPGGFLNYIRSVNTRLACNAPEHIKLIDTEQLCASVGETLWHDQRLYHMAKQPMSMDALPIIANSIAASASAILGKSRKVLVLDLDNTLWGGTIGDDGLDGITLGPETSDGESFLAFQEYLKSLSERGIVLAVCSKNSEKIALQPFREHGAMVLQESDFPVFVANYKDKATNIREIAKTLNVGLDSVVFADDSPVECALVRKQLPEVWVVELSGDPSEFIRRLDHFIPFPVASLTEEDFARSASYQSLNTVHSELQKTTDIEAFLRDLKPVAILEHVRDDTVERMSQLIAKTNQYKLNPTTFSTSELRKRSSDVLAFRLKDSLQDYGIVSVIVTEPDYDSDALILRNWVMSCRVFSRRLEFFIREKIAETAAEKGLSILRLEYLQSGRNDLICDLLPTLGFSRSKMPNWFEADTKSPENLPSHFIALEEAPS